MAINPLRPHWMKIKYITAGIARTMTIPIRLSAWDGVFNGSVSLENGDATTQADDLAATTLCNLLRVMHSNATDFIQVETWQQLTAASTPQLMSQRPLAIVGSLGTGGVAQLAQVTYTFKTLAGGRFNLRNVGIAVAYFGTTAATYQSLNDPTGLTTIETNLRDYLIGATHPFTGRDNSRPVLALNVSKKINDTLRKRAMRLGEIT